VKLDDQVCLAGRQQGGEIDRSRKNTEERAVGIRIVTDSNCDLPDEIIARYRIAVVPLYINIGSESYVDGVELSRQAFYRGLAEFEHHPTTSVPGEGKFRLAYNALAAEGATEILSIHIAASLSAVTNSARLGAEQAAVPVRVFDSGQLTLGTGLQVLSAAQAAAEGASMDDIVALVEDQAKRTHTFAALDTVEFLRRSGRLSGFQSSLASVLSIKPLLKMHRGKMDLERIRTRRRSIERLMDLVSELGSLELLSLVHTGAPQRAQALHEQASHLFPAGKDVLTAEVTPVIGAHVGPGAVGFAAVQSATATA
jgi:DegV family protein with EDD domain